MQRLHSDAAEAAARLKPIGRLDGSRRLRFAISLPVRDAGALAAFLAQLQDPASPRYHHYLKPAEFASRFGPSKADYDGVITYAKAHGLAVAATHPGRMVLDLEGPVSAIEAMLHVTMRTYRHPREPREFYAPDAAPALDVPIPVLGISGLDNYEPPLPHLKRNALKVSPRIAAAVPSGKAAPEAGSGPDGCYMGNDFRAAYAAGVQLTGSGQSVALVQFDGYTPADISYYESLAGIAPVPLVNVLVDGFNGAPTGNGGEIEVSLDIELVASMAPGVSSIRLYEAGPNGNFDDVLCQMADDDAANQISCSWYTPGGTADPAAEQIFQQMAAQGQSFFAAGGDSDAYTGLIPFPDDSPHITVAGGTTLTTPTAGGPYVSETAWNWDNGDGTGGGISTQYPIPSWQQGIDMTANLGSISMRNVPDVAMVADNVYVRVDGQDIIDEGGTSCASPLWAALVALINQQGAAGGESPAGFLNPLLYAIAGGGGYAAAFHDITAGNNFSASSPAHYPAVTGYDLCTGWGSPIGAGLISAVTGAPLVTTAALPGAFAGAAYSGTLGAIGGAMPYTWAIASGSTPAGLLLSPNGILSGTPLAAGSASFTVQATGSNGLSATASFSMTVFPQGAPVITTASPLATGTQGAAYGQSFAADGGAPPYAWAVVSGSVPAGLSLDGGGLLSGTPAAAGVFSFTVEATGSDGLSSTAPFAMVVPQPPTITSTLAATGTFDSPFSYQIIGTFGPSSYSAQGLPAGLSVDPSSGLISGTPSVVGTSTVTIQAFNNGGAAGAALALDIEQLPPPVITAPFTTLVSFNGFDGAYPIAGLVTGTDGNFYGTTVTGAYNYGMIFQMTAGGTITTLGTFNSANGAEPFGGLCQGTADGAFYGATSAGGSGGNGTVFQLAASGSLAVLHAFTNDGSTPYGTLAQTSGSFYGTTVYGGDFGAGIVFAISPGGGFTTLTSLADYGIGYPTAGLTPGSDGNLYGTTAGGGFFGGGTVFQITPGGEVTPLVDFYGGNGEEPIGGLVQGADGSFYGTTYYGGSDGSGAVFSTDMYGNMALLCSLTTAVGTHPEANLIQGIDGNFYGVAYDGGGANDGTVFVVSASGSVSALYSFSGPDGANPQGALVQTADGTLYGTTTNGGAANYGTIFRLTPFQVFGAAGSPFTYQIAAASTAPLAFDAKALPAGLSVDPSTGIISGTPAGPGTAAVSLCASNASGSGSGTLTIVINDSFAAWRSRWFASAALADPTQSGGTAAPAGDGMPNLMKYAFGVSPYANGEASLPALSGTSINGATYLTLTYLQNLYATDLTYTPQVTGDFQTWSSGPAAIVPVSATPNAGGVTETVTVRDAMPMGPAPAFMRVQITAQ